MEPPGLHVGLGIATNLLGDPGSPSDPSKIEWDLTNGPLGKLLVLLILRSVGPVGDFLDLSNGFMEPTYYAFRR